MARIRTIKPEFFTHDGIGALEPLARLAFIGLLCIADREGRLEDRPRSLRVQVLPYDNVDFDSLLDALNAAGFIRRYEVAGQHLIQVRGFKRHQRPNPKESESTLPPPPSLTGDHSQSGSGPDPIHDSICPPPEHAEVASGFGADIAQRESGSLGREGNGREGYLHEESPSAGADGDIGAAPARKRGRPQVERHPDTPALCDYLVERARSWKPDVRIDGASKRSVDGMDALLRIDGRDPAKVRTLLDWLFGGGYAPHSEFDWRPLNLSGASLRKHWDQIETQQGNSAGAKEEGEWTGR